MPLVLSLKQPTTIPLEVDALSMEAVRPLTSSQVERLLIQHGNELQPVGEFFRVRGSAQEDAELHFEGECESVKWIGSRLSSGKIVVHGNAGMHLGAEMTGGEILVEGDAHDWAGAELQGGTIRILGNAGHQLGAVYRGGHRGMTGGTILVHGNAGNEIGHSMRRGLIAIGGSAGDFIGYNLLAGTILVCGAMGIRHGAGMRRGSIIGLSPAAHPEILPTFRSAATCTPGYLRLYFKHLKSLEFPLPESVWQARFHRYCGDFLELGRGEILLRESA